MKGRQGFTLMELLVVLLIIGILSTVALRTIDATRDRGLFDQTTKEMNQLAQALVGNPDLTYDGRRVDFGYFGDMESLPSELRDLVHSNGDPAWKGPYLRIMAQGDTAGYLYDGWGNPYTLNPDYATISTEGNGKYPMTVKIVDEKSQLYDNIVSGSFLDRDGNPPGIYASTLYEIRLYYNNPLAHGGTQFAVVRPEPGGSYEISNTPEGGNWVVPIGIHEVKAIAPGETLTRYVTVAPRSHTVVDFKFTRSFWEKLRMYGSAQPTQDSSGFRISIVNDQPDAVTINWIHFFQTPDSAFMRDFLVDQNHGTGFPRGATDSGVGNGDTAFFAPVTIAPEASQVVELLFHSFYPVAVPAPPHDTAANVCGKTFQLRFDDASEIKFTVPFPP
jgi:prepilin-type N-terminal cleavage/methylation domain-containing protein